MNKCIFIFIVAAVLSNLGTYAMRKQSSDMRKVQFINESGEDMLLLIRGTSIPVKDPAILNDTYMSLGKCLSGNSESSLEERQFCIGLDPVGSFFKVDFQTQRGVCNVIINFRNNGMLYLRLLIPGDEAIEKDVPNANQITVVRINELGTPTFDN